jgi:mitochondrial fission protein ELM1
MRTGDLEKDIQDNLQRIINIFQSYILKYPKEYLWIYKIWKYSQEKNVLILDDRKTGHLRQSQAIARMLKSCLEDKGFSVNINTIDIKFKNKFSKYGLISSSCLATKSSCQGCLWCLRAFLTKETHQSLINIKPDIVISCGSAVAPINYVISRENLAKSIAIMRPSLLSTKRFNLVVMSKHDRPPERKNVTVIGGALNLIDENYLQEQGMSLKMRVQTNKELVLGLLVGGDTKVFHLSRDLMKGIIDQIKKSLEKLDAQVLITTSRRTQREIECLLKEEFSDYPRCKLLIIANEKNIPEGVPGILLLSKIIITSPESISMISEAVSSKRYVLVFNAPSLGTRHKRFLEYFAKNKYISLVDAGNLSEKIQELWLKKPEVHTLNDNLLVAEAIKKIL